MNESAFAPAGATFFRSAAKEGKGAPGEPFHKGSPGPLLTAKGLRPIGSPAGVLRRTRDEGRGERCGGQVFFFLKMLLRKTINCITAKSTIRMPRVIQPLVMLWAATGSRSSMGKPNTMAQGWW